MDMQKKKRMSKDDKSSFIVETEMAILAAIREGHRCADDDQFAEARKLVEKYRIELGHKKPEKKRKK